MTDQQDSSSPRPWGDPRDTVRENRSTVRFIFVLAVVLFVIAALVDWPTDRAEVCGKFSALSSASGSIEDEIKDLRDAAEDYRGTAQDAVRADADRIGDDLLQGSGWKWLDRDDMDKATGSIRALCGDGPAIS
ncbi:hypothetical protein [Streptomyces sp. NBC_00503]|uniref:hypothetical protein n=1 Tax=Streptomyces sp. NBC_00503 TaxID=2903659 RepID=UPI002E820E33|nr:hypothetical protein [Streptomyces sp. NBC_00503]WUD84663.1 hypothetical protein OG490_31170 [Streptomyces sp. NBC_00503]